MVSDSQEELRNLRSNVLDKLMLDEISSFNFLDFTYKMASFKPIKQTGLNTSRASRLPSRSHSGSSRSQISANQPLYFSPVLIIVLL